MTLEETGERKKPKVTRRRVLLTSVGLVLVIVLASCTSERAASLHDFFRGYAEGESGDLRAIFDEYNDPEFTGQIRFTYDDFGGLNTDTLQTNAAPWKVVAAALLLDRSIAGERPATLAALNERLSEFGFIRPQSIKNWQGTVSPRPFKRALGIITGDVARKLPPFRIEVFNLGCAACHAGVTYDAEGIPTNEAWIGLPNTSLDLEAYSQAIYRSIGKGVENPDALLQTIKRLYPDVNPVEYRTIENYVIPLIRRKLSDIAESFDAPVPFGNGSPGVTNGVSSLKHQLGLLGSAFAESEVGYTSIPDLGGTTLRSALLYDGAYTTPGEKRFRSISRADASPSHRAKLARIAAFFTVPSMGIAPNKALKAIPRMMDVMTFLESYSPPPFPGRIDLDRALMGSRIYHDRCAQCHGDYSDGITSIKLVSLPNRWVSQEEMGTDPIRWKSMDSTLVAKIQTTAFKRHIVPAQTKGYASKALSGLWATAPYLHNGSVPSLWQLMNPDQRPAKFYVGGHRLDFDRVGIAGQTDKDGVMQYPQGYLPWSTPRLYDTTKLGHANSGHEKEFSDLSEQDKKDLLEYLKLL